MPLTWSERLPVISPTGRADVVFGGHPGTSLARARTVGFSYSFMPFITLRAVDEFQKYIYINWTYSGKRVAAALGTLPEQEWLKNRSESGAKKTYIQRLPRLKNEVFLLSLKQGRHRSYDEPPH